MNVSTKPLDTLALGYFFSFSLSSNQQWQVDLDAKTTYRATVNVFLPESLREKWVSGFHAVIRRLKAGRCCTIRLDYENVSQFFTMEQLQSVEKANPTVSFYLYGVPTRLAKPVTSCKLDIDAIQRAAKRNQYAQEQEQRRIAREATTVASS